MDGIGLSPDLERYADEAVAAGRFRDRNEVVETALRLLQRSEADVATFIQSLEDAKAEGERDGFRSIEQIHGEMSAMLDSLGHTPD